MTLRIPQSIFQQALFALCIIMPYFYNYELTFAVWAITAAITVTSRYSFDLLRHIACYLGIFAIAAIVMFFKEYKLYYIVRDITYMIKPVLGLLVGYQLCKKINGSLFRAIVLTGLLVALLHYALLAQAVIAYGIRTVSGIRMVAGYFSDFEVYALIILIFHKRFRLGYPILVIRLLTLIIGVSALMYMARTNIIQFVVFYMALKGLFSMDRRSVTILGTTVIAAVIGYSAILYYNPKRNGAGIEALLYKIKNAPIEPFKTKINKINHKEFHDNYRSYENILTIDQVGKKDTGTLLFGKGLGSTVDLKMTVFLGDEDLRYISLLHNGFMIVFLKSGLTGIAIFLISLWLLFKQKKSDLEEVKLVNQLMLGTALFMIVSAWVFMGFYFTADTKAIVVGALICYREMLIRRSSAEAVTG